MSEKCWDISSSTMTAVCGSPISTAHGSTSTTTVMRPPLAGHLSDWGRSGSVTRRSPRFRSRSSGRPICHAVSFVCEQDRSMPRWLADTVARRLGVEQVSIDTSHSPFLSRPGELAQLLVHATTTTPVAPYARTDSSRNSIPGCGSRSTATRNAIPRPALGAQKPERMAPLQSAAACRSFNASW